MTTTKSTTTTTTAAIKMYNTVVDVSFASAIMTPFISMREQ